MDANMTELLARIELLEDDVRQLQDKVDQVGVVFEADMDIISPEWLLFVDDEVQH